MYKSDGILALLTMSLAPIFAYFEEKILHLGIIDGFCSIIIDKLSAKTIGYLKVSIDNWVDRYSFI